MELMEYKKLLINYPQGGEDPFTYNKGDKPYFLWLDNRHVNCSLLYEKKIEDLCEGACNGEYPKELDMGYTGLNQLERVFLLHVPEGRSYYDIYNKQAELVFCKEGMNEEDLEADFFLFVLKKGNEDVIIDTASWKCNLALVKALTGKDKYSIADARKIIPFLKLREKYGRANDGYDGYDIFACIGVRRVSHMEWH